MYGRLMQHHNKARVVLFGGQLLHDFVVDIAVRQRHHVGRQPRNSLRREKFKNIGSYEFV